MLPALVEGLSLVHAVPVATKVATVPVVTEVAVLVAVVTTVTASLMELEREGERQGNDEDARPFRAAVWLGQQEVPTHLARMSPVPTAVHVAATSSVHVPSV